MDSMLEVCVDSLQSALVAEEAGAQRIELCHSLEVGGVSPCESLIQSVRRSIQLPLIVLIRARAGNFVFHAAEIDQMICDSKRALELGADGIAIGGLLPANDLDISFLETVARSIPKCELVMHRAFDEVRDPRCALRQLTELGFQRVLTSGGPIHAMDGIEILKSLNAWSNQLIEILPGGGIGPSNAYEVISRSGCRQLHGSFRNGKPESSGATLPNSLAIRETLAILNRYLA
jgi:copper homeostasis protein